MDLHSAIAISSLAVSTSIPIIALIIKSTVKMIVNALEEKETSIVVTRLDTLEKSHDKFREEITKDVKELEGLIRQLLIGSSRVGASQK